MRRRSFKTGATAFWRDWFEALDVHPAGPIEGNGHECMSLVLQAALSGHGVALAPSRVQRDLIDDGRLRTGFGAPRAPTGIVAFGSTPWLCGGRPCGNFRTGCRKRHGR
ncbi:MAG: hypothetical protein JJ926_01055 [Roseitalea sp.]|nr:hypothetical protein [Roseitalea sp.]MBO6950447.1 hypothetical protein [Rhizobiaceae bacterium]MBO6591564.1 hypothetical protein [Roseitalea sp.]MBO6599419.1 hypothetical protein [Roseitalea sp.]MBO6612092.1 hypothetical protein [Roseitalea sp.]